MEPKRRNIDRGSTFTIAAVAVAIAGVVHAAAAEPNQDMLAALRPFHGLVGNWKGTGTSTNSTGWREGAESLWGFRERDGRVSLNVYVDDGKLLDVGLLTYDPKSEQFRFIARDKSKNVIRFEGKPVGKQSLQLDRVDKEAKDGLDRLEIKLVRGGDKLIYSFRRKKGRTFYEPYAQVELFREGRSLREFKDGPRCIVSGGAGRMTVEYGGNTYHVSDEGTREEFLRRPDKYIQQQQNRSE